MSDPTYDLPDRIVVGANGAYWRDYGDHYSMAVVSEDNDPIEIVAIYNRQEADATAWDRGFAAGLTGTPASQETALREALEMYQSMYLSVAAKWGVVLDAADKAEDVQPDEAIEALRRIDPDRLSRAIEDGTSALDREMVEQGVKPTAERLPRLAQLIAREYAALAPKEADHG